MPGNNSRFLEKAKQLDADITCLDLEDSVPDKEKKAARKLVRDALRNRASYASSIFVRINAPTSKNISDDLKVAVQKGIDGIVIPKADTARQVKRIIKNISALEKKQRLKPISVIPSIESARGVINTYDIASADRRIAAVVFGIFDLLNDMRIEYSKDQEGAKFSRSKVPVDAAAAGVAAIDGIWQDIKDSKGLELDCMTARNLGYSGKSIIHPEQIHTAHRVFCPTKMEIQWAEKVCKAYLRSAKTGKGATTVEGKMIDEVHFKQAKALLEAVS